MASDPKKTSQPNEPSREQMMRVLIPAGTIAVIVILAAVLVAVFDKNPPGSGREADDKGKLTDTDPPPTGGTDVSKMTDGSDPTAEDKGLENLGSSGLKYRDLKIGDGPEVRRGATVKAYYTGWLINGHVFDSSRKRGTPEKFSLNEVVAGWKEGLPGMRVGGIRKLFIPPELGYGSRGAGRDIPPNATLIFEVEIVSTQ
ncbi:MAG TPA: FKBP-type peptidyl-prolyl cis-trans isomerase [Gemmata sp.]|nr:FKBP-type peptidyl-prolyl cis-trans isomerase [Gemmata sp.]